jgi:hypothetical protein
MLMFYEFNNGKWMPFADLLSGNNRTSDSFYFENGIFKKYNCGKSYKFSDLFDKGYDWVWQMTDTIISQIGLKM